MKIYILLVALTLLIIAALSRYLLRKYFKLKAKKMTEMELVDAQIREWEPGWFHKFKYEIYCEEHKKRPQWIPPSDVD